MGLCPLYWHDGPWAAWWRFHCCPMAAVLELGVGWRGGCRVGWSTGQWIMCRAGHRAWMESLLAVLSTRDLLSLWLLSPLYPWD